MKKESFSRIVIGLLTLAAIAAVWFWIAGRVTWWQGWVFLLVFLLFSIILMWRISKVNPDLLRERNAPAEKAESWDRLVMGIYTGVLGLLMIVSALDGGRYGWSDIPLWIQMLGWLLLIATGAVVWNVMMTNAYLSSWARIQDDRGQVVIQDGLYRIVRHPMYLGIIAGFLGTPLVLNSWWAMIPAVVIVGLFIYRTYREDKMLMEGLVGYVEYAQKVRFRLLPGIW